MFNRIRRPRKYLMPKANVVLSVVGSEMVWRHEHNYLFKNPRVILHRFVSFITVGLVQVFIDEPNGKFELCNILLVQKTVKTLPEAGAVQILLHALLKSREAGVGSVLWFE